MYTLPEGEVGCEVGWLLGWAVLGFPVGAGVGRKDGVAVVGTVVIREES